MRLTNGQIVTIVRECMTEADAEVRAEGRDPLVGSANFDVVVLKLDHPRPTLARALTEAGVRAEWENYNLGSLRGYGLRCGVALGFCGVWTSFCEAWAAKLTARGVPASVRYMMD